MDRDKVYLLDILEAAKLALSYLDKESIESFCDNIQCQDAVIRRLEIIGEAAKRISESTRTSLPDLPWREMIGMRNFMIHEYDNVDLKTVYNTVKNDLPPLIESLEKLLNS